MASSQGQPPAPTAPHLGPVVDDVRDNGDRFEAAELGVVLSHFELGVISRIRDHRRGSRRAPKLRISAERGEFLLKRRAPGKDDPYRVAFAQDLQLFLADRAYPVPALIGTRGDNNSMLQLNGRIYEMFTYVRGQRDDKSVASAHQAGYTLGWLHRLLAEYRPTYTAPTASYHDAAALDGALKQIPAMVATAEGRASSTDLEKHCQTLHDLYRDAARRVDAAGFGDWTRRVLHGDWHPGNLLYHRGSVTGVLDFDSARMEPRMIDVANAALQFSMKMTDPDNPDAWPDRLDVKRIRGLLTGYDLGADEPLSPAEREALPWLIIEALILESVVPIAATGRFAQLSGSAFLKMVQRKARWLRPRAAKLLQFLQEDR